MITSQELLCLVQNQIEQWIVAFEHTLHCRQGGTVSLHLQNRNILACMHLRSLGSVYRLICSCRDYGLPSLPPDSFTLTPLSTNFAKSSAFSFLDILPHCR